ncbi:MAG: thiaminase II [Peptoniphilaceae bacterium]|nr:thiaminase II [Peptoniphilaceae bacterium]MDD7382821.1 thiaminase II [Peptoniphilaceae bacterium]MDY3738220.1 thiaminase II [Peptoniphilaceae bacterium]
MIKVNMNKINTIDYLLKSSEDIWQKYYYHPFVKGIEQGNLDKNKFRYYIIQDFLYLEEYLKVFSIGIAKSTSIDTIKLFSKSLFSIVENEMSIHSGYMGKFKISKDELRKTKRELDNISYTSYMLRIAYEESEVEIISAILSCALSYELIARKMIKDNPNCINDDFFGKWIKGYSSDEYKNDNRNLINALNTLTENYTDEKLFHLNEIFNNCSKYELLFWNFSWNFNNQNEFL